jgi:hypothetical protein
MSASCSPLPPSPCIVTARSTTRAYCRDTPQNILSTHHAALSLLQSRAQRPHLASSLHLSDCAASLWSCRKAFMVPCCKRAGACAKPTEPCRVTWTLCSCTNSTHRGARWVEGHEVRLAGQLAVVRHLALCQVPHPQLPVPAGALRCRSITLILQISSTTLQTQYVNACTYAVQREACLCSPSQARRQQDAINLQRTMPSAVAHLPTLRATVPLGCTATLFTLPLCPSIVFRQSQLPACRHRHTHLSRASGLLATPRSLLMLSDACSRQYPASGGRVSRELACHTLTLPSELPFSR